MSTEVRGQPAVHCSLDNLKDSIYIIFLNNAACKKSQKSRTVYELHNTSLSAAYIGVSMVYLSG